MQVKILQEHGVPLYSTSIQSYAKQLEDSLTGLEGAMGSAPVAIIERSIGRSTYHLAIFRDPAVEESAVAPVAKASKAKTKAPAAPVDESLGDVVAE
jgi:hypothetical protein